MITEQLEDLTSIAVQVLNITLTLITIIKDRSDL
jgi:hypothetical protein